MGGDSALETTHGGSGASGMICDWLRDGWCWERG